MLGGGALLGASMVIGGRQPGLRDDYLINQPRRVPIDSEVLDLC